MIKLKEFNKLQEIAKIKEILGLEDNRDVAVYVLNVYLKSLDFAGLKNNGN